MMSERDRRKKAAAGTAMMVLGLLAARAASATTHTFGHYDEETGLAVPGETWTFDHGSPDPLEGWAPLTPDSPGARFRWIDASAWAGGGNSVTAPILAGAGSAWLGFFETEADEACWKDGVGYGNGWIQRLVGPPLVWDGVGTVDLDFVYFTDLEEDFDFVRVLLLHGDGSETVLPGVAFTGRNGIAGNLVIGEPFTLVLEPDDFQGETAFRVAFEMTSDGAYSDEDGFFDSDFGPFGVDDIALGGALVGGSVAYGFEGDLDGWTPESRTEPDPSQIGVLSASSYPLPDGCGLNGNVLELHDETFGHPFDQSELLHSNTVSLEGLGTVQDIALEMSMVTGPVAGPGFTFFRVGFRYWPVPCPETGAPTWDLRMADTFFVLGAEDCIDWSYSGLAQGIPTGTERVEAVIEMVRSPFAARNETEFLEPLPRGDHGEGARGDFSDYAPLFDDLRIVVETTDPAGVEEAAANGTKETPRVLTIGAANPFAVATTLYLDLPEAGNVLLDVIDVGGRVVAELWNGPLSAGRHELRWDGADRSGRALPSGTYWTRLVSAAGIEERRVSIVR